MGRYDEARDKSIFEMANKTVRHVSSPSNACCQQPSYRHAQPTAFNPWIYPSSYLHNMHQIDAQFTRHSGVVPAIV